MRDYFVHPAQTNLELYLQAIEHGYTSTQRRSISSAYQFALMQVYPMARGSGKPFISHLVGTASLVLASECPDEWVIGALLHALYQRRVPFAGGVPPDERPSVVASRFGSLVADIVLRYTEFEDTDLSHCGPDDPTIQNDILTLRLADELEDITGYALALHGNPLTDDPALRGSYLWRRNAKSAESHALLALAQRMRLHGIRRGLEHWLDFASLPAGFEEMRTGWLSSVNLETD